MALEYVFEHPAVLFQSIGMPADTRIDPQTLEDFGKVLMIIAGADNKISVWERGWLAAYMSAYGAPQSVQDALDDFDYKTAQLDPILEPLLHGKYARWVRRSLVQGAIRMSRADTISIEEYRAILYAAELLDMNEDTVEEVQGLLNIFDSVNNTNFQVLTAAQNDDLHQPDDTDLLDSWDDAPADANGHVPMTAESVILSQDQLVFAQAILYIMGADGDISDEEMDEFVTYIQSWGATDGQINALKSFDYHTLTAESIIEQAKHLNWGLSALTSVALRVAGADGLSPEEENALTELYRKSNHSMVMYYATKGLEEVRRMSLARLNAIFAEYLA